MSNLRSIVERTVQHLAHFQMPIPLFAALVVFSSLPLVARTPSTPVSTLATSLQNALSRLCMPEGVPLLSSLFDMFTRAINTAYLRVRIHIRLPILNRFREDRDDTYPTLRAEAKYWRVAGRYRRRLYSGNGTAFTPSAFPTASRDRNGDGAEWAIPLVTYYTPRLLPLYRDRSAHRCGKRTSHRANTDIDAQECRISPRTFCKWHRMVFHDSQCHPTLAQAAMQIKYYSTRDLREIQRIARLLPDEQVFDPRGTGARKVRGSTKYRNMWKNWLENKGMDLAIVFE